MSYSYIDRVGERFLNGLGVRRGNPRPPDDRPAERRPGPAHQSADVAHPGRVRSGTAIQAAGALDMRSPYKIPSPIERLRCWSALCLAMAPIVLFTMSLATPLYADETGSYSLEGSIPADSKYWDYSTVDSDRGQLYVGRLGGVLAVDLKTKKLTEPLFEGELIHAVVPVLGHLVVAADGAKNELKVYDLDANSMLTTIAVGGHPDAIAFDQRTNTVVTVNKESQDLTLVDAATWKVRGTVKLTGDPEFAASNGDGTLYVNIADQGRIDSVDIAARHIISGTKLKGCRDPSGIAYDRASALVISVCGNGLLKFLAASDLKEVASIAVGRGADAVILDEQRRLVFVPAGTDGVLNVVVIRSATDIALLTTVKTAVGASSGAVDPASGRVYLPTGRRIRAPAGPGAWHPPAIAKGSFRILVIGPNGLITH